MPEYTYSSEIEYSELSIKDILRKKNLNVSDNMLQNYIRYHLITNDCSQKLIDVSDVVGNIAKLKVDVENDIMHIRMYESKDAEKLKEFVRNTLDNCCDNYLDNYCTIIYF